MGLWKFLKKLFGGNQAEDRGCDKTESCKTPEICDLEVPTIEVVETKDSVVKQAPVLETKLEVQAEVTEKVEDKVTAKEIKAKSRKPRAKKEVKEVAELEVKEEKKSSKPRRRRRKPKAKPENGDQA